MDPEQEYGWVCCVAPLVLGQLLIRPLHAPPREPLPPAAGLGGAYARLRRSVPIELDPQTREHFVYSGAAQREGRWWSAVLHMLAHTTDSHLANNVQSLVFASRGAYQARDDGRAV